MVGLPVWTVMSILALFLSSVDPLLIRADCVLFLHTLCYNTWQTQSNSTNKQQSTKSLVCWCVWVIIDNPRSKQLCSGLVWLLRYIKLKIILVSDWNLTQNNFLGLCLSSYCNFAVSVHKLSYLGLLGLLEWESWVSWASGSSLIIISCTGEWYWLRYLLICKNKKMINFNILLGLLDKNNSQFVLVGLVVKNSVKMPINSLFPPCVQSYRKCTKVANFG